MKYLARIAWTILFIFTTALFCQTSDNETNIRSLFHKTEALAIKTDALEIRINILEEQLSGITNLYTFTGEYKSEEAKKPSQTAGNTYWDSYLNNKDNDREVSYHPDDQPASPSSSYTDRSEVLNNYMAANTL